MLTSDQIFKFSKIVYPENGIIKYWHEIILKSWYGRGKAEGFKDVDIFYEIGKTFPTKNPYLLYRGLNVPKGSLDINKPDETLLLKYCSGVRSWSERLIGPKYYATTCLSPKCISIIYVWNNPNPIMSGSRIDKVFKKYGFIDLFDTSEWVADAKNVRVENIKFDGGILYVYIT